ncbi:hypothetical protein M885DRAFT_455720 [Pelagophyceae sp. CCMP2097]|nr:hypothetical protein M885DRAFT_455720 [Pelagophyceae sp. CCMP2097]|mmetsp:Transcript_16229/g.54716  ORF Transcript_16229/g.54716 Transcript_16229/m.54716 type:complete len:258 (-) Transcript_16229:63-836(-)
MQVLARSLLFLCGAAAATALVPSGGALASPLNSNLATSARQGRGACLPRAAAIDLEVDGEKGKVSPSAAQWYMSQLETRPMSTKMWTAGIIGGCGDALSQILSVGPFRAERCAAFVCVNAGFVAPMMAPWFGFLNGRAAYAKKHTKLPKWAISVLQVSADQTFFVFTFYALFFPALELAKWAMALVFRFEYQPITGALAAGFAGTKVHFWPTLLINWRIWPLVNLFNFGLVPPKLQLLVSNVISVGWNYILSLMVNR